MICFGCDMEVSEMAYHPYAACLMFRQEMHGPTVEDNLRAVVEYGMEAAKAGVSLDDAMRTVWRSESRQTEHPFAQLNKPPVR